MWDEPSAEVTQMKKTCETMLEAAEEDIEDWYFNHQDQDIQNFICRDRILKNSDQECLTEVWTGTERNIVEEQTLLEDIEDDDDDDEDDYEHEELWKNHFKTFFLYIKGRARNWTGDRFSRWSGRARALFSIFLAKGVCFHRFFCKTGRATKNLARPFIRGGGV